MEIYSKRVFSMKEDKRNKQSYTGIRIGGILSIIFISCLTAFAVNMVLVDINDRADATYRDGLASIRSAETSQSESLPEEISAPESSIIVEESSTPQVSETEESSQEVSEISEVSETSKPETSKPEVSKPESPAEQQDPHDIDIPQEHDGDSETIDKYDINLDNCTIDNGGNLVYTVQTGDWLSVIASRFHSSVEAIGKCNHIANVDLIYTGDRYVIPVDDSILQWAKTQLR